MVRKQRVEVNFKNLNGTELKEFMALMTRDIENWCKYNTVRATRTHEVPENAVRWVLARKGSGAAKTRLVIREHQDCDLEVLATTSPTTSRRSRGIFLPLASRHHWGLKKGGCHGGVSTRSSSRRAASSGLKRHLKP